MTGRPPLPTTAAARHDPRDDRRSIEHTLHRNLVLLALVTLVTAWFGETFFHPDEHFQVVEFLGAKLGRTAPADLPWEYRARIRPWMQPFLYWLIARPLTLAGVVDPFDLVRALRIATGAASIAALWLFATTALRDFATVAERRGYARSLIVYGFLPYLFVRTSSETLSAAGFTAGLALVFAGARAATPRRLLAAGLAIGVAVECRFQVALLALGLWLWLAIVARTGWRRLGWLTAGALVPVALALPIDRWGYGVWTFPPWAYVRENIVNGTAARDYGTDPVYGYLYLLLPNVFLPLALLLVVAGIVACVRHPRHVATWTALPFVLVQSLLAHKEERFLFPLAIVATLWPILAFAPSPRRALPVLDAIWRWRRSLAARAVAALSLAAMALLAVYPLGWRPDVPMARHIYRTYPDGFAAWTYDATPFASYPIYRPRRYAVARLRDPSQLAALLDRGPVLLLAESPWLPADALPAGAHARLLFTELPFADRPAVLHAAYRYKTAYDAARARGRALPHFAWLTLFRITRPPR